MLEIKYSARIWNLLKRINYSWHKEELPQHWKDSILVPIYKMSNETDCSNYTVVTQLPTIQYFIQYTSLKVKSKRKRNYWGRGVISMDFDVTDQLPIRYSALVRHRRKKMGVQLDRTSDEAVFYNILIEFSIPTKTS